MTGPAVHRFSHQAMGTMYEVLIAGEDREYAGQAARAAFGEIDRLERLFSRFDPSSEIARAGRLRPGEELMVGVETFDCLALAEEVRLETGGAFDVNARAGAGTGPPAFELARSSGRFVLRRPPAGQEGPPGLDLDLGAIGKGWALDKALEVLGEWSVGNALLHGGTSTALAVGSSTPEASPHSGWPVGAGGGWPGTPGRVLLAGRALSGSGTEVKGAHILDPRTGRPAAHQLAAWASAPSAALSDALSTAFFAMSAAEVEGVTRLHPDVWACLVLGYGDVRLYNESLFPALP